MSDENILSQEEIDALLNQKANDQNSQELTPEEKDTFGELGNISMGTSATTLYTLLGKKVKITTPKVSITTVEELRDEYPVPFVIVEVKYTQGLEGTNVLVIKERDAKIIADLMMGGEGKAEGELDEIRLSAVGEAMNQMMGSAATSMSQLLNKDINISPPSTKLVNFAKDKLPFFQVGESDKIVKVSFNMEVEDLISSEIMQLSPIPFVKRIVQELMDARQTTTEPPEEEDEADVEQEVKREEEKAEYKEEGIPVKTVKFDHFEKSPSRKAANKIDLILDVPLEITVELGRTSKKIKDILEFGPGSIIELDKMAGEPVDILVNGKFIAKGEVVVIDENFGVRITEIITPIERLNNLQ